MTMWLPVVVLTVTQISVRLIGVAAMIWQERARADSRCAQMRTAAANGVALLERQRDGTGLAIVPQGIVSFGEEVAAAAGSEEASVS